MEKQKMKVRVHPSKTDIATKLLVLAEFMADVAFDMDYYGGFRAHWAMHAYDLMGASGIAKGWAQAVLEEVDQDKKKK